MVARATLRSFRSYAGLDLGLAPGLVLVVGRNGAGKTNLLEAVHVGAQGFSPRTRAEPRLVRFGEPAARVGLEGTEAAAPVETEVTIAPGEGKRLRLNGAPLASAEELRTRLTALAFVPDRLAIVKGGPAVRRAYVDRMLGRVTPSLAALPGEYGRALAQRNEALRRVRACVSTRAAVEPWTERVSALGTELDAARADLVAVLAPGFAEHAAALGLPGGTLGYEARPPTAADLEARLERDLERGTTGLGPHLRDIEIRAARRDLRGYGSQGEQRTAVLALLLAEAGVLTERRDAPPLLLLDDVLSELDAGRRRALLAGLPPGGQTLVSATSLDAVPADAPEPALVVTVRREGDTSTAAAA
ncbi:MAG TPA: DNA replication and repair protein RecF [Gaiellaceae bacterium]|nr:DNA replication and repair protein RecF [Gaiellaceae bacterium]